MQEETQMVSMIIVLFLAAVAVPLLFGRIAETLENRLWGRLQPRPPRKHQSVQVPDARNNKVASKRQSRSQAGFFHSLPVGAAEK